MNAEERAEALTQLRLGLEAFIGEVRAEHGLPDPDADTLEAQAMALDFVLDELVGMLGKDAYPPAEDVALLFHSLDPVFLEVDPERALCWLMQQPSLAPRRREPEVDMKAVNRRVAERLRFEKSSIPELRVEGERAPTVRYRDNQVVSTRGERYIVIKEPESEEMKKTYVNLVPGRRYRFH